MTGHIVFNAAEARHFAAILDVKANEIDGGEFAPIVFAPLDIVIFCPRCNVQHIDAADPNCETCGRPPDQHFENAGCEFKEWTNPPHKSHRCKNCNLVFRPADVPTNGVLSARTRGGNDNVLHRRERWYLAGWNPFEDLTKLNIDDQKSASDPGFAEGPKLCPICSGPLTPSFLSAVPGDPFEALDVCSFACKMAYETFPRGPFILVDGIVAVPGGAFDVGEAVAACCSICGTECAGSKYFVDPLGSAGPKYLFCSPSHQNKWLVEVEGATTCAYCSSVFKGPSPYTFQPGILATLEFCDGPCRDQYIAEFKPNELPPEISKPGFDAREFARKMVAERLAEAETEAARDVKRMAEVVDGIGRHLKMLDRVVSEYLESVGYKPDARGAVDERTQGQKNYDFIMSKGAESEEKLKQFSEDEKAPAGNGPV
jgi:hypothetical protein